MRGCSLLAFDEENRLKEERNQLLEWLQVRDTLVGENQTPQDLEKAVLLASQCKHPDAVWLTKLVDEKAKQCDTFAKVSLFC
jgi:hypothetical protein